MISSPIESEQSKEIQEKLVLVMIREFHMLAKDVHIIELKSQLINQID